METSVKISSQEIPEKLDKLFVKTKTPKKQVGGQVGL